VSPRITRRRCHCDLAGAAVKYCYYSAAERDGDGDDDDALVVMVVLRDAVNAHSFLFVYDVIAPRHRSPIAENFFPIFHSTTGRLRSSAAAERLRDVSCH